MAAEEASAAEVAAQVQPGAMASSFDPMALLDALPDPVVIIGFDATLRWANASASTALGWIAADWLGRDIGGLVHPDDLSTAMLALDSVQGKVLGELIEIRVRDAGGTYRRLELRGRLAMNLPGVDGVVLVVRDVTDRRRWELASGDDLAMAAVLDAVPTVAFVLTRDGRIRSTNRAFTRLLGHPLERAVDRPLTDFVAIASTLLLSDRIASVAGGSGDASFEVEMLAADGSTKPVSLTLVDMVADGVVNGLVATATDISELVAVREQLRHAATHDDLTGLPNRSSLARHLDVLLVQGSDDERSHPVGLVFADVDRFKEINDRHGHLVGDAVLVEIAERLADAAHDAGMVARLGSDEFVLVTSGVDAEGIERLVDRFHWTMRAPVEVAPQAGVAANQMRVSLSIGSVLAEGGESADDLIGRADAAMYREKLRRRADR